jgi:transcriptional regulator with XRE-family HTH domain
MWRALMQAAAPPMNSLRDLALRSGVAVQTITRLVFGEATSDETVRAVAEALGISEERVWELHGQPRPNPFVLDRSADRLSPTQRAAVKAVIAAMLEPEQPAKTGRPLRSVTPDLERTAARKSTRPKPSDR